MDRSKTQNTILTMKKLKNLKWLLFFVLTASCNSNENTIYTSIAGIWRCEENDEYSQVKIFSVDIQSLHNYNDAFIISNFHNVGEDEYIRVNTDDSLLYIPTQSIAGIIVNGEGLISPDFKTVTLQYSIDDAGNSMSYNATLHR
jgi:hypothetical protein